jgi:hypothetical protein
MPGRAGSRTPWAPRSEGAGEPILSSVDDKQARASAPLALGKIGEPHPWAGGVQAATRRLLQQYRPLPDSCSAAISAYSIYEQAQESLGFGVVQRGATLAVKAFSGAMRSSSERTLQASRRRQDVWRPR